MKKQGTSPNVTKAIEGTLFTMSGKEKKKTFQHEQHQIVVEALVGQTDRLSSGTTEKNYFLKIDSLLHFLFYLWCVLAFTHLKIC